MPAHNFMNPQNKKLPLTTTSQIFSRYLRKPLLSNCETIAECRSTITEDSIFQDRNDVWTLFYNRKEA